VLSLRICRILVC